LHRNMHNKIHSVISPLFRIKNADTETGWNVQILRSVWIISAEIRYLLSEQKKFQNKSKNIDEVYQSVFFRCIMFLSYRVTFLCNVLGQIHYTSESPVRYFFYEKVVKWCFVYKQQMEEYLPKALSASCRKLNKLRQQYFCFNYQSRDYRLLRSDIFYMERKLRNTEIHTKSQIYYCREKIPILIEQLKPDFCICHKSFAVNINTIHTFSHAGIELSDGTHIPVSRNYYQATKDAFAQLLLRNSSEVL